MSTTTYENRFITQDIDLTFNMIEDESGDVFWGYGHREADEFRAEVNRWLAHMECGENCIDGGYPVEHLWASLEEPDGERFKLVPACNDPEVFPVTRLMI